MISKIVLNISKIITHIIFIAVDINKMIAKNN